MKKLLLLLLTTLGFTALLQAQTDVINITNSGGADKIGVGTGSGSPQSSLDVFGSYGQKVTTVSANLTLDVSHNTVVCNPAGGSFIVTLPAASGCSGRVYVIKRNATVTANTVTIAGGSTIDGAATFVLNSPNQAIEVFSDGTEWKSRVGGLSGLTTLTAGNDIDFGTSSSPNSIDLEPVLDVVHTINAPTSNNLNLNAASGFAAVVNYNNGTTGTAQTFRVGNGAGADAFWVLANGETHAGWLITEGTGKGWRNGSHGGGWYMDNNTHIKSWGDKSVYVTGDATTLRMDGLKTTGSYFSAAGANSSLVYANNSTGDFYSLPAVNNATLVTNGSGVPSWQAGTTSSLAWLQTGNSGTTASTSAIGVAANNNFIGTTDAKDFVMATSGLERMRITSNGNVGIGIIAPTSKLYLNHAFTSAGTSESAAFINTSNTATITADRIIRGLQVQALNRQTENGFNGSGFGIDGLAYTDGAHTFNWLRGGNFSAYSTSTSATDQDAIAGTLASGYNNGTGTVTSVYGAYNQGYNNGTGTSANVHGAYNLGFVHTNAGTITNLYGSRNYAFKNSNSAGNVGTAYGTYSQVSNIYDNPTGAITTGYAYYGTLTKATNATDFTTTFGMRLNVSTGTTRWGVYTENEQKNYFSGNVGITATSPVSRLDLGSAVVANKPLLRYNPGAATAVDYAGYAHNDFLLGGYVTGGYPQNYISFGHNKDPLRKFHIGSASNAAFDGTTTFVPALTVMSGGNVGIGSTAPASKLVVNQASNSHEVANFIQGVPATYNNDVWWRGGTATTDWLLSKRTADASNDFWFYNPGLASQVLTLKQNGTVIVGRQVGTVSPNNGKLQVLGNSYAAAAATWPDYDPQLNANSFISYRSDAGGNGGTATAGTGPTDVLYLAGNYYDSRAVITVPGSGGATPADQGSGRGRDIMMLGGMSDNGNGLFGGRVFLQGGSGYNAGAWGANYGAVALQSLGGNVGIGTTDPTQLLDVNGLTRIRGGSPAAGKVLTSTDANGNATWSDPTAITYDLNYAVTTPEGWIKLGTLTLPQQGFNAFIEIHGGVGYNADVNQNSFAQLFIRTSNAISTDANGFAASAFAYRFGKNENFISRIKLKANAAGISATSYEVFIYTGSYTGKGFYTVTTSGGSWVASSTAATDPGNPSSTICEVPFEMTAGRRDWAPYGTPSYVWDGSESACSMSLPITARGSTGIGVGANYCTNKWGNKWMFTITGLSQEAQNTTTAPTNGIYLNLPATAGVHNNLLISTIDNDRWSGWSVWLCNSAGTPIAKIARSMNNASGGGSQASTYMLGPYNSPKETGSHAWLCFPVTRTQVDTYISGGNLRFLLTSSVWNQNTTTLYLSGFAMVPNPYGFMQHPAIALHYGLNGDAYNEMTWNSVWNNDGLCRVNAGSTAVTYVKVVDPTRDLLVTFYMHNDNWFGSTVKITVGSNGTVFRPRTGIDGIGPKMYANKMYMQPQSIIIPKAIVAAQLTTSACGVPNVIKLNFTNVGEQHYHFRGIDTEIY